ncbi:MAG: glycosyltransferase [Deltaproteobacteria bacterium]|nr:glycosyltransferase [Deltaproteobacteria bacterium]
MKRMRILLVAMANSIHTARWIDQIADQGWDLHLFPSTDSWMEIHADLRNVTLHHTDWGSPAQNANGVRFRGVSLARRIEGMWRRRVMGEEGGPRADRLARLVTCLAPDIVHSLEIQHAGYLTLEAKRRLGTAFPPWIVTNWGSDIYLFGRLAEHARKIRDVLAECDCYSCECLRDVALAKSFGFAGTVFPVFPNAGGFNLAEVARHRQEGPASARRAIMLKGYQHWGGRALTGLRALERCADLLGGYEVWIYSATPDVAVAAELFAESTGIRVTLLPKNTSHKEILARHGRSRISIGLSISDAISTSLLEAMAMGSFPIQSWTSCADEWIEDGRTGFLVHPDDPDAVESAIRKAILDDGLVDRAAEENLRLAALRLDQERIRPMAVDIYRQAGENARKTR